MVVAQDQALQHVQSRLLVFREVDQGDPADFLTIQFFLELIAQTTPRFQPFGSRVCGFCPRGQIEMRSRTT